MTAARYPTRKVIAVDVDDTLHVNGRVNQKLVKWCEQQKANGYSLMLWSARGKQYAQAAAEQFCVAHLFDDIVSKPGYIVDDQGWSWIKFTHVVRRLDVDA